MITRLVLVTSEVLYFSKKESRICILLIFVYSNIILFLGKIFNGKKTWIRLFLVTAFNAHISKIIIEQRKRRI